MGRIFSDIDGLRDSKSQFESVKSELEDTEKNINDLIARMEQTWHGGASDVYINNLRRQSSEIHKLIDTTEALIQSVQQKIDSVQWLDNTFGRFFQNLAESILSGINNMFHFFD